MKLTNREKEILNLISKGLSNKEIANKLYVSVHTIKANTISLYRKIGAKNRVQATRM
ncbi:MAG: LuxR C-terminal-related transcriptional regulator [Candidatus Gastranaerophilaceae bacterium]|nr:LuxR C-terminal-related transcriptional regulator [Candidatus Gastranaerophilaceae bacterium]